MRARYAFVHGSSYPILAVSAFETRRSSCVKNGSNSSSSSVVIVIVVIVGNVAVVIVIAWRDDGMCSEMKDPAEINKTLDNPDKVLFYPCSFFL